METVVSLVTMGWALCFLSCQKQWVDSQPWGHWHFQMALPYLSSNAGGPVSEPGRPQELLPWGSRAGGMSRVPSHSAGETGIGHITTSKNSFKFLEHCSCVQDNVFTLYVAYKYILIKKKVNPVTVKILLRPQLYSPEVTTVTSIAYPLLIFFLCVYNLVVCRYVKINGIILCLLICNLLFSLNISWKPCHIRTLGSHSFFFN